MSTLRLASWNVNGIRSVIKKELFFPWLDAQQFDIIGLQETKISADLLTEEMTKSHGYHSFWSHHVEKKGYSGVALLTRGKPLSVCEGFGGLEKFDAEGRILIAEYENFVIYNIYYPNGERSPERLQYKLEFYDALYDHVLMMRAQGKKLVLCGDFNTAHKPIDLARPKENENRSGFLPIERAWMDKFVEAGFIDTFRFFHDEPDQYSWWNVRTRARERNVGWRIDYFFVSDNLKDNLAGADIQQQVFGSDHCPVTLELKF